MGTYHYYLSTKTKRVFINGKPEDVGLIMFSHKESWDNANPKYERARNARLSRNENIWARRDFPKYVMHATKIDSSVKVHQNDPIYYWGDRFNQTNFPEGTFMLMAGTLNIVNKKHMEMQSFYTMVLREDMMYLDEDSETSGDFKAKRHKSLQALREMVSGLTYQTKDDWNQTHMFIHCLRADDMSIVKLHFPHAQQVQENLSFAIA